MRRMRKALLRTSQRAPCRYSSTGASACGCGSHKRMQAHRLAGTRAIRSRSSGPACPRPPACRPTRSACWAGRSTCAAARRARRSRPATVTAVMSVALASRRQRRVRCIMAVVIGRAGTARRVPATSPGARWAVRGCTDPSARSASIWRSRAFISSSVSRRLARTAPWQAIVASRSSRARCTTRLDSVWPRSASTARVSSTRSASGSAAGRLRTASVPAASAVTSSPSSRSVGSSACASRHLGGRGGEGHRYQQRLRLQARAPTLAP